MGSELKRQGEARHKKVVAERQRSYELHNERAKAEVLPNNSLGSLDMFFFLSFAVVVSTSYLFFFCFVVSFFPFLLLLY